MRKILIALTLLSTAAHAAPKTHARKAAATHKEDPGVAKAKQDLATAKLRAKLAKAKEKADKAIEACEQVIVDICVAGAKSDGSTDCEDTSLIKQFAVCH